VHSQQLQPQVVASRKQSLLRRDSRPENHPTVDRSERQQPQVVASRKQSPLKLQPHQNNIGDDGAAALAHALDPNYSLLRLGLGNNQITEQCADNFAAARHERAAALAGRQLLD
jgi:hypothetical protein